MREGRAPGESREEFTSKVKAAYELMRVRDAAQFVVGESQRRFPLEDSSNPQTEFGVRDRARWEALKSVPAFRKLVEEEESIFTGGASPQEVAQYATVYQRAYELAETIDNQVRSIDTDAYLAASAIRRARKYVPWDALDKSVIDNMVDEQLAKREVDERKSAERREYWDLMDGVQRAVEGMRAKALLASQKEV